jgi:hypothetical protein
MIVFCPLIFIATAMKERRDLEAISTRQNGQNLSFNESREKWNSFRKICRNLIDLQIVFLK